MRLQQEKEQLMQQAVVRNRTEQTQQAIHQAEIQRERLLREIQGLQRAGAAGAVQGNENLVMPEAIIQGEDAKHMTSLPPVKRTSAVPLATRLQTTHSSFRRKDKSKRVLSQL